MSYGSYACHASILTEEGIFELSHKLGIHPFSIEEIDNLYFEVEDYLDDMQREFCEIINSQDLKLLPDDLDTSLYDEFTRLIEFINLIEEHTGLVIELKYEGETGGVDDDINQEFYWEVLNTYQYTPPAEKYKHYIVDAHWVIYG